MNTRSEKYEERIIQINTEEIEAERWNRLLSSLERIAAALEMQVPDMIHKRRIQDYDGFDFATIGAEVVDSDQYGATQILYRGKIYKSPNRNRWVKPKLKRSSAWRKSPKLPTGIRNPSLLSELKR